MLEMTALALFASDVLLASIRIDDFFELETIFMCELL
jgi:hypothetical protein